MIPTLPVSPDVSTDWSGYDDFVNAPPDYDSFVRQYISYTKLLCVRGGVPAEFAEDVAHEIICRFIERGSLEHFDPHFIAKSGRRSKFRSYYSRFVVSYVPGKCRNSVRLAQHEPLILDAPLDPHDPDAVTFGDVLAGTGDAGSEATAELECADLAERIRAGADSVASMLLDALVVLTRTGSGTPSHSELAAHLGWKRHHVTRLMADLRVLTTEVLAGEAADTAEVADAA